MIQCGPEAMFPGNRLCACRWTGLTHMFTFLRISCYLLWRSNLTTSLWTIHRWRWGNTILVDFAFESICVVQYWWGAVEYYRKFSTISSWVITQVSLKDHKVVALGLTRMLTQSDIVMQEPNVFTWYNFQIRLVDVCVLIYNFDFINTRWVTSKSNMLGIREPICCLLLSRRNRIPQRV
jgi:hypothetical protein